MKIAGEVISYNSLDFKKIFYEYFPSLTIFADKFLNNSDAAKDVVQEAFVKIWQKSDEDFDSKNAVIAYLYVLIKNACISILRKEKKISRDPLERHSHIPNDTSFLNEILKEETYRLLGDAINRLSPQAEKVMKLTLDGLTVEDISLELDVSINTIKTVKKRAYKAIRDVLGKHYTYFVLVKFFEFFN